MAIRLIETLAQTGHLSLAEALDLTDSQGSLSESVDELTALGFPIGFDHDGLCWLSGADRLSPARLRAMLSEAGHDCPVDCLILTDSTNLRLLARAVAGECGSRVLLAECQNAGRGRRQRPWLGRFGESILFSLLVNTGRHTSELPGLAIAVGVTLAKALAQMGVTDVTLKWPNDLLLGGSKLAGVLVEAPGRTSSLGMAVIGVGMNWRLSDSTRVGIDQPVADLAAALPGAAGDRTEVAGRLISALLVMSQRFRAEGVAPFLADYGRFDALFGRKVDIQTETGRLSGIAQGLAADGALRVAHDDGERVYRSADVSVKTA